MFPAPGSPAPRNAPLAFYVDDPRPLAERFEAPLRVIDDHEHYAARLAQRLYLWRGRAAHRAICLQSLSAKTPIANEASLGDEDWAAYADADALTAPLLATFATPPADPAPDHVSAPDPDCLPPPGDGPYPRTHLDPAIIRDFRGRLCWSRRPIAPSKRTHLRKTCIHSSMSPAICAGACDGQEEQRRAEKQKRRARQEGQKA